MGYGNFHKHSNEKVLSEHAVKLDIPRGLLRRRNPHMSHVSHFLSYIEVKQYLSLR